MVRRIAAVAALISAVAFAGCDTYSCENACNQIYGDGDGQCSRDSMVRTGEVTTEAALEDCVADCEDALYTVSDTPSDNSGDFWQLNSEEDAINFVECVVNSDYSDAAFARTCENLDLECPWIRW